VERRPAFVIERGNFAIEGDSFSRQQFQGIEQLRVMEVLLIARNQPHLFAILEGQGPIAVKFDFVEPVALRQFLGQEGLHRFDERGTSFEYLPSRLLNLLAPGEANDSPFDDLASGHSFDVFEPPKHVTDCGSKLEHVTCSRSFFGRPFGRLKSKQRI
jgi:hypothetical protein